MASKVAIGDGFTARYCVEEENAPEVFIALDSLELYGLVDTLAP